MDVVWLCWPAGKGSAATISALRKPAADGSRNLHYMGRSGVVSRLCAASSTQGLQLYHTTCYKSGSYAGAYSVGAVCAQLLCG